MRLAPMCIMMAAIFYLSHQPGYLLFLPPFKWSDKLVHFTVYALLGSSVVYAFPQTFARQRATLVLITVIVVCGLYGIGDEYHQSFIPGRYPSATDALADGLGGLCAGLIWYGCVKSAEISGPAPP